ncbi:hypothetical protein AB9K26_02715 [Psychroserpens sp. XS_ASV72]|uniref:hypothetical protein n=1 Tax=Psychroserpens sp. XS_ASV72 TaxID=3241293 RepID=UPI003511880C
MNTNKIMDCERSKIERWSRFQLSNSWKTIGVLISVLCFVTLMVMKISGVEPSWINDVLKRALIVGFLIISLSKEKDEDEMIASLRAKSYALAFIFGVLYSLVQPAVDYVVHNYIYEASENNTFSYFQVLWFMLLVQIMFFEVLKRNR